MNEDIEEFLDSSSESSYYLESLAKTRQLLMKTSMVDKLDEVILAEIELALMGAQKAKSEILKTLSKENKLVPIK